MGGPGLAGEAKAGAATANSKNKIKNRSWVIHFVNNTIKVLGGLFRLIPVLWGGRPAAAAGFIAVGEDEGCSYSERLFGCLTVRNLRARRFQPGPRPGRPGRLRILGGQAGHSCWNRAGSAEEVRACGYRHRENGLCWRSKAGGKSL